MNDNLNKIVFFDKSLTERQQLFILNEEESHHAIKVLRLKKEREVFITNGTGLYVKAKILEEKNKRLILQILQEEVRSQILPEIHLAVCPVKKRETLEWLVEKCTEMGISKLVLFTSKHSERTEVNIDRLEKIMLAAVKQSMTSYIPQMTTPIKLNDLLNTYYHLKNFSKLIGVCEGNNNNHISKIYNKEDKIVLLIGPEGGFTSDEIKMAKDKGFIPVWLGENRLRTETASIYSIASVQALFHQ